MRKLFIILSAVVSALFICNVHSSAEEMLVLNEIHFPDPYFRDWVIKNCDSNQDGVLSDAERNAVTEIYYEEYDSCYQKLKDLKGIEYFPNLECILFDDVDISRTDIKSLDVSNCKKLIGLYCSNTDIKSLDLYNADKLTVLWCGENEFLKELILPREKDVLELVSCEKCKLSKLDLTGYTNLWSLAVYDNELVSLQVQGCTELSSISCFNNQLKKLTVLSCKNNKLSKLDLRRNVKLRELYCDNNRLKKLNLSQNKELRKLSCRKNQIKKITVKNIKKLKRRNISCDKNTKIMK